MYDFIESGLSFLSRGSPTSEVTHRYTVYGKLENQPFTFTVSLISIQGTVNFFPRGLSVSRLHESLMRRIFS